MAEHDKTAGQGEHKLGQGHHAQPAAGLHSPADRGARASDDKAAEQQIAPEFSPEQLATPAPMLAGSRPMYIIVGPYRGSVLTMPDAEAEDAKDSHWAVEMSAVSPPFDADNPADHDHELTDEDRAYAVEAANAWAAKVNEPPPEPAVEGETADARREREQRNASRRKAMQPRPDGTGGDYQTRALDKSRR